MNEALTLAALWDRGGAQQSLLTPAPAAPPTWVLLRFEAPHVQLTNANPEAGLPFVFTHLRADWVDVFGTVRSDLGMSYPGPNECVTTTLFPGQRSELIKVSDAPPAELQGPLRLRFRVWFSN